MKKILLLLFVPMCGWAQFAKGDKFVGGTVAFDNQNSTYNKNGGGILLYRTYSISPSFGLFLKENLAIGISAGYSGSYQTNTGEEFETATWSAGFFARRFYTLSDKFLFAINGSLNFSRSKNTYINHIMNTSVEPENYGNYGLMVSPLFVFMPTKRWGFQASVGSLYFNHIRDLNNDNWTNNAGVSAGTLTLGVAYYF